MDSTQTKPDALEMLRRLNNKYFPMHAERGTMVSLNLIVAALEAERRENAERDAKIRSFLEEAANDSWMLGRMPGGKAQRARTNIAEALALLDGGAE